MEGEATSDHWTKTVSPDLFKVLVLTVRVGLDKDGIGARKKRRAISRGIMAGSDCGKGDIGEDGLDGQDGG